MARVEEARARAGIAKSYLYPQVDGVAGYSVRQASNAPRKNDRRARRIRAARTASGCRGRSICSAACGGRRKPRWRSRWRPSRARRGVLVTLVGDVASNYFLLRELDLQLEIARRTLQAQRRDGARTSRTGSTAACRTARSSIAIRALRAQTAAAIPEIERQIARRRKRDVAAARHAAVGRFSRQPLTIVEPMPPPMPPGLPTSLLERRPGRRAGRAVARRGQRRHRRGEGARSIPTISLTGFLGGVSGDLTSFLGGDGAVWSLGAGLLQPIFQAGRLRRNYEAHAGPLRRGGRPVPEGGTQRLPRGGRLAGDDPEARRRSRLNGRSASPLCRTPRELSRARYDSGLASYIEILTADQELFEQQQLAGADARRGTESARGAVSRAGRWLATLERVSKSMNVGAGLQTRPRRRVSRPDATSNFETRTQEAGLETEHGVGSRDGR